MKFGPVRLEAALGKILGHNVAGADGKRRLRKGRALTAEDLEMLRSLGRTVVYVAEPGSDDVVEDEAVVATGEGDGAGWGGKPAPSVGGRVGVVAVGRRGWAVPGAGSLPRARCRLSLSPTSRLSVS